MSNRWARRARSGRDGDKAAEASATSAYHMQRYVQACLLHYAQRLHHAMVSSIDCDFMSQFFGAAVLIPFSAVAQAPYPCTLPLPRNTREGKSNESG